MVAVKSLRDLAGQLAGEAGHVAVRDEVGERSRASPDISLSIRCKPLDQAADVVRPVAVLPDGVDDLLDGARGLVGRLDGEGRHLLEVFEQGAVEAVEDGEVRLVG